MGASGPFTLSVFLVAILRGIAEQQSKCERSALTFAELRGVAEKPSNAKRYGVARRSQATKRGSVLRTAPREVGEQGIEP